MRPKYSPCFSICIAVFGNGKIWVTEAEDKDYLVMSVEKGTEMDEEKML